MAADDIMTLESRVNALDREHARRVARLVLECRAPLKDALRAVEMADTLATAHRPLSLRRWLRERAAGQ